MLKKLSFIFSTVPLFHRCSAITGGRSGSAKGKKGKRERGGRKKEKYRSQNEIPTKDKAATLYLTCTRDAIKYYNEVLVTERGGGDPTTHARGESRRDSTSAYFPSGIDICTVTWNTVGSKQLAG